MFNERLRFNNNIGYIQAYRVKQALLVEIEGYEANCSARFPAYLQHIADTDDGSLSRLSLMKKQVGLKLLLLHYLLSYN